MTLLCYLASPTPITLWYPNLMLREAQGGLWRAQPEDLLNSSAHLNRGLKGRVGLMLPGVHGTGTEEVEGLGDVLCGQAHLPSDFSLTRP